VHIPTFNTATNKRTQLKTKHKIQSMTRI